MELDHGGVDVGHGADGVRTLQRANQVLVPAKAARLPQCRSMAKTADGGEEGTVMDAVASTLMYYYRQISRAYLGPRVQVLVA